MPVFIQFSGTEGLAICPSSAQEPCTAQPGKPGNMCKLCEIDTRTGTTNMSVSLDMADI